MNLKGRPTHLKLGWWGENLAAQLLRQKHYILLARNWRTKAGELDIVARDGQTLVFVEVKTLRDHPLFTPGGNLSAYQRKRNATTGKLYRKRFNASNFPARYDLIEIVCHRKWPYRLKSIRHTANYLPPLLPQP